MRKIKCPTCHTNLTNVRKCLCGCYVENCDENTWKQPEWMARHELWENGEFGYNIIYVRINELKSLNTSNYEKCNSNK